MSSRHGFPWEQEEINKLIQFYTKGESFEDIAIRLGRTTNAVELKYEALVKDGKVLNDRKFYMLYAENGRTPTVKYSTKELANEEAERLALTLREPIYMLETIAVCHIESVIWKNIG